MLAELLEKKIVEKLMTVDTEFHPTTRYISPKELRSRLSYIRFTTDEIQRLCDEYTEIEINRPAPHRVRIEVPPEVMRDG